MTDLQTVTVPHILEQYKQSVDELFTLVSNKTSDEEKAEQLFLKIITLREKINRELTDSGKLDIETTTLHQITTVDEKLYNAVQLLQRHTRINPAKWQYILPDPENAGWWWRLHQIPVWMDDKIEYESRFSIAVIPAIILIGISLAIVVFSTQQMWASGEQWIGNITLIGQVLVGAGLVSESGREIATRLLNQLTNFFQNIFTFVSNNNQAPFPLAKQRTNISLGILGASILFFSFVFIFTILIVPASARWFHSMGVRAVEERNVSRAEFYLELAVAVQPDFAPLPLNFSGAPSFAQLGNLYREIGNLPAAQEAYENALGEDARTVNVHYRLAEIYMEQGNLSAAFAVLDRALVLLSGHLSDFELLPLGENETDSDNQARQLLYLTLVTRAKAFFELDNGYFTSLRDLDNARLIVERNPDLFVTERNLGDTQPGRILTTEMHVLYARSLTLLTDDSCARPVRDEWRAVRRLSRFARASNEQLWLDEANVSLDTCR